MFTTKKGTLVILSATILASSITGVTAKASGNVSNTQSNEFLSGVAQLSAAASTSTQVKSFKDLAVNHWAYSSVMNAMQRGYVQGYSDGTFRPEAEVTVAEFTQIIMNATGTKMGTDTSKWYNPAIDGARAAGFMTKQDYSNGNYNKKMTRAEMAKMAVLAVGESASSSNGFVLQAVKMGLLTGVGGGKLDVNGTTNRAQSVVIAQRVITLQNGGKLTVDEAALAAATELVEARVDAWGQAIRTTNLPSNYKDYHYILKDFPNKGYELKYAGQGQKDFKPASQGFYEKALTKENLGGLKDNVESWFNLMFNLDYRTIGDKWIDGMYKAYGGESFTASQKDSFYKDMREYVNWVKENKLVTEGNSNAEVSTIVGYGGRNYIKVNYSYKVVSGNKSSITYTGKSNNSIFRGQTDKHSALYTDYKLGTTIEIVSEIEVVPGHKSSWTEYNKMTVNKNIDISSNFVMIK